MEDSAPVIPWRRRLPLALIVFPLLAVPVIYAVTGTRSAGPPAASESSTATESSAAPSGESFTDPVPRLAIAYDTTGRGKGGLNELAWQGAKRAADTFGAELREISATPDDTDADRE